jgi:phage shock protein A
LPDTLIENYVVKLDSRLTGLEENVQKLTTIINKIVNDQAVFDYKQEQSVRVSSKLEEMVERAREKIEAVGTDFIKECDRREARLNEALNAYKNDVEKALDKHKEDVDSELVRLEAQIADNRKDIKTLQRVVNLAVGGGTVLIFVLEVLQNGGLKILGL